MEGAILHRGDQIDGRFTIDRLAEVGGMGEVYRAIDERTREVVAIKVLRRDRNRDGLRFEREAQILAGVEHPHVVRHVAHGTLASGERYLAMEWLEGETLDDRLNRRRLTLGESVQLGLGLAETLGALHRRGIVHRDLKPSNVFLVGGALSEHRLLDLGIAWNSEWTPLTQTGMFVGSLRYAAPEQVIGARIFDARTDVFSLGIVLFECLTGAPAFDNQQPMVVLTRMATGELPRLRPRARDLPEPLVDLVDRMLARDPQLRPADGDEVARALRALGDIAEGEPAGEVAAAEPSISAPTAIESPAATITTAEQAAVALLFLEPSVSDLSGAAPEALAREAEGHGGRLEWLGDGSATVLVEGPAVATDLAARAARCALALRGVPGARPLTLAVGPRERAARSMLGSTTELATRMLSGEWRLAGAGAGTGTVTLDADTAGLLDGRFEVRRQRGGDLVLIGEREIGGVRMLLGRPAPCVGRDRELRQLEELFDDCVRDGQAQAVLVTAPPGGGKTRLAAELVQRLRGRGAAVWTARAGLPGEVLTIRGPDDEASLRIRAARRDPGQLDGLLRAAFVELVAAAAAARPIVLLLEDLHGDDAGLVQLIRALRELAARPLYVVALARPEAQELLPRHWTGRLRRLALAPLDGGAGEQLVRHALGDDVRDEALAQIVRLSDGNAFLLEELIRTTAEGRTAMELPGSAVAMMQSRLAGLDAPLRRALRAASVFGEVFWTGGVARLIGGRARPAETDALLGRLVELELVTPRSGSRFAGQTELALRHALLREAAYAMLTPADRTLGHRLAAEWLERHGEPDPLVLAEHFDRGGQEARAAACYLRAAEGVLER